VSRCALAAAPGGACIEGRRFVVVKDGDRQRRQDVRVGIVSLERIEILEGLKEGDIVVGQ
jgi:hypothetical protein